MRGRGMLCLALALLAVVTLTGTAGATTLIRASLDDLVRTNEQIVVAEVADTVSYWNSDGTFILTDVQLRTLSTLKGQAADQRLSVTLMGGTVGDTTALIMGGAELIPGQSYVLFLNSENLPGAERVTTVRDHCQGAYEIQLKGGELRAVSQANSHPLVPDRQGYVDAPGGVEGFPLEAMLQSVRETVNRLQQEVKQ